MTFASTSRQVLRYIKEVAFGTTPGSGTPDVIRYTGESLKYALQKEESKEIRSDRQVQGATTVAGNATGGFNFHMQYAEYDKLFEALLMDSYTIFGTAGVGSTFTGTFLTGSITAGSATSGANIFTILKPGQFFRVISAGLNNGKLLRVHASTAPTSTVITLDAATPATAEVISSAIQTSRLTNGTTQTSWTLEKESADIAQLLTYRGMNASKMSLKFKSRALLDGSMDFMGVDAVRNATTQLPGTPAAAYNYEIMNASRGVGQIWEGTGLLTGTNIKSLDLDFDNGLRVQDAVGSLGAVGFGVGDVGLKGKASVYFANGTLYDKFLADTYSSWAVTAQDASGNGYAFSMPRVLIMDANVVAGSKASDLMAEFDFQAFADLSNSVSALQKTLFIDRFGVAVT